MSPSYKKMRISDLPLWLIQHYMEHAARCVGKLAEHALEVPREITSLRVSLVASTTQGKTYKVYSDLSEICRAQYPHLLQGMVEGLFNYVVEAIRTDLHNAGKAV